jgi:hypothetical protein
MKIFIKQIGNDVYQLNLENKLKELIKEHFSEYNIADDIKENVNLVLLVITNPNVTKHDYPKNLFFKNVVVINPFYKKIKKMSLFHTMLGYDNKFSDVFKMIMYNTEPTSAEILSKERKKLYTNYITKIEQPIFKKDFYDTKFILLKNDNYVLINYFLFISCGCIPFIICNDIELTEKYDISEYFLCKNSDEFHEKINKINKNKLGYESIKIDVDRIIKYEYYNGYYLKEQFENFIFNKLDKKKIKREKHYKKIAVKEFL